MKNMSGRKVSVLIRERLLLRFTKTFTQSVKTAKTLLENYGYRVIDLGVQVPLEKFDDADAIGMCGRLHMITVQQMMHERGLDLPLLIAPVNSRHAAYVSVWPGRIREDEW